MKIGTCLSLLSFISPLRPYAPSLSYLTRQCLPNTQYRASLKDDFSAYLFVDGMAYTYLHILIHLNLQLSALLNKAQNQNNQVTMEDI